MIDRKIKLFHPIDRAMLTHLPDIWLRQRSAGWKKSPRLTRLRRISRYQISISEIVYTHSCVESVDSRFVLEEVISGIEVLREDVRRDVRVLRAMSMSRRFFALLAARFLSDSFLRRHIKLWIFLSPVTCHQFEIHLRVYLIILWCTHPKQSDGCHTFF